MRQASNIATSTLGFAAKHCANVNRRTPGMAGTMVVWVHDTSPS